MKIYTSYFSNSKKLSENGIVVLGVSLWPPKWFNGHSLFEVAPKAFMLKSDLTREQYIDCYQKYVLDKLDAYKVIASIEQLSYGRDVALCCFEKPGDFCHRHLLSKWLTEKTGIDIEEFGTHKEEVKVEPIQFELDMFY